MTINLDYSYRGYKKHYEDAYQKECQKPSDVINGNTVILGGQWASEFYHFIFEVLGKITLFCRFLELQCIDNIVLRGYDKPFINDAIRHLVPSRIKIIKSEYLRNVKFETVFLPSMICILDLPVVSMCVFSVILFKKLGAKLTNMTPNLNCS